MEQPAKTMSTATPVLASQVIQMRTVQQVSCSNCFSKITPDIHIHNVSKLLNLIDSNGSSCLILLFATVILQILMSVLPIPV